MKRISLALAILFFGASVMFIPRSAEAAIDQTPDCDTVAVIKCGAFRESALRERASKGDVPRIYNAFGIQQNELNGFADGVVWRDGRVTVGNDRVVARNAMTAGRWNNPTSDMQRIPNTDRAHKMSTSHFVDEGQVAFIKMVNGQFKFAVIKTCGNPVTANPVRPAPEPTHKCESLTMDKVDRNTFRFTASHTAENGAKFVKYRYEFGDGKKMETTKKNVKHTYAKPGDYTARVTVIFEVNGKRVEDTRGACTKKVTVEKPPVGPEYACNFMNVNRIGNPEDRKVRATMSHTAKSGATFSHYLVDFGDGTAPVKTTDDTLEHTYAQDGTYTAKTTVVVTVDGEEKTATADACMKTINFGSTPPPPEEPEQEVPEELADTGPGVVAGVVFSTFTGSALAYRYVWLRRFM